VIASALECPDVKLSYDVEMLEQNWCICSFGFISVTAFSLAFSVCRSDCIYSISCSVIDNVDKLIRVFVCLEPIDKHGCCTFSFRFVLKSPWLHILSISTHLHQTNRDIILYAHTGIHKTYTFPMIDAFIYWKKIFGD